VNVSVICGSHPRNCELIRALEGIPFVNIQSVVLFEREEITPPPPEHLADDLKRLWITHFSKRASVEQQFFTADKTIASKFNTRIVRTQTELNSQGIANFINKNKPEACFITGIPILRDPLYSNLPAYTINLHLGLIPEYKGAITMFWPFYMLEPKMAGCSYHIIGRKVDTGQLIHQFCPKLELGDTMHLVAARATTGALGDIEKIICWTHSQLENGVLPRPDKTLETRGKLFTRADFTPEKLRVIYDLYDDKIVDLCLRGEIESREPSLVSVV